MHTPNISIIIDNFQVVTAMKTTILGESSNVLHGTQRLIAEHHQTIPPQYSTYIYLINNNMYKVVNAWYHNSTTSYNVCLNIAIGPILMPSFQYRLLDYGTYEGNVEMSYLDQVMKPPPYFPLVNSLLLETIIKQDDSVLPITTTNTSRQISVTEYHNVLKSSKFFICIRRYINVTKGTDMISNETEETLLKYSNTESSEVDYAKASQLFVDDLSNQSEYIFDLGNIFKKCRVPCLRAGRAQINIVRHYNPNVNIRRGFHVLKASKFNETTKEGMNNVLNELLRDVGYYSIDKNDSRDITPTFNVKGRFIIMYGDVLTHEYIYNFKTWIKERAYTVSHI